VRSVSVATAFCLISIHSASAADFDQRWNGFYVGASAGWVQTTVDWADWSNPDTPGQTLAGAVIGAQAGFDMALSGPVVVGVVADASLGNHFDSQRDGNYIVETGTLNAIGTIRGRLGLAIGTEQAALVYGTGGFAWANMQQTQSCPAGAAAGWCVNHGPYDLAATETLWGWAAGGGAEVRFADGWSGFVEGLYFDLGEKNFALSPDVHGDTLPDQRVQPSGWMIKTGINRRL
jgi:opacity protein-like surface antigen